MRTGTRASLFRGGSDVLSHPQRRQSSRTAKTYHTIVSKFVHSLIFVHSSLAISLLFLYIIRLLSLVMSLLSVLSRTLPFSWALLSFCLYRFLFLSFEIDFSLLSFSCIRHFSSTTIHRRSSLSSTCPRYSSEKGLVVHTGRVLSHSVCAPKWKAPRVKRASCRLLSPKTVETGFKRAVALLRAL